jgi:hypothetical protein
LLAHRRWFSPDTPASSTTTTGRHDITEILLKPPKIIICIGKTTVLKINKEKHTKKNSIVQN